MDLRRLFPVRIALFMVIIVTFIAALAAGCNQSATPADIQASPQAVARAAQGSMAELAGKVLPCVVYILVDTTETDFFGDFSMTHKRVSAESVARRIRFKSATLTSWLFLS